MYKNMYVCELPDDLFCKVYKAIKANVTNETDVALAINSKVKDLEDMIDIREILEEESA